MPLVHNHPHPVKREVQTHRPYRFSLIVAQWQSVSSDIILGTICIVIRIRPFKCVALHADGVEIGRRIVMHLAAYVLQADAVTLPTGIRLKKIPFVLIVIRFECNRSTNHIGIQSDNPFNHGVHGVRFRNKPFGIPQMVQQSRLAQRKNIFHPKCFDNQFVQNILFELAFQLIARIVVLAGRYYLQQNSSGDNHTKTSLCGYRMAKRFE